MRVEPHTSTLPDFRGVDAVKTFALRVARLLLLRRHCGADHPVLSTEEDLVQMARSRLQEYVLAHVPEVDEARASVDRAVRELATRKVLLDEEDVDRLDGLLEDLRAFPLDDIFPRVH